MKTKAIKPLIKENKEELQKLPKEISNSHILGGTGETFKFGRVKIEGSNILTISKEDKLWNFVLACPSCNIRKSNKIPGMEYVKVIQSRNDVLRKLDSAFVQNQFKTYKPQLISDMWKYAQSGGFVVM